MCKKNGGGEDLNDHCREFARDFITGFARELKAETKSKLEAGRMESEEDMQIAMKLLVGLHLIMVDQAIGQAIDEQFGGLA